jgi:hypothetical protein
MQSSPKEMTEEVKVEDGDNFSTSINFLHYNFISVTEKVTEEVHTIRISSIERLITGRFFGTRIVFNSGAVLEVYDDVFCLDEGIEAMETAKKHNAAEIAAAGKDYYLRQVDRLWDNRKARVNYRVQLGGMGN